MPKLFMADPAAPTNTPMASPDAFGAGVARAQGALGESVSVVGKIMAEYASSKSRASAAQYQQALTEKAAEISLNPNIEERAAAFDAADKELRERYRPTWATGMPHEYDAAAGSAGNSIRIDFEHRAAMDAITETKKSDALELNALAIQAAEAESDDDSQLTFAKMHDLIQKRRNGLVYSDADADSLLQDAIGESTRVMAETNPERALRVIDRFGAALKPEVTSVYRSQAYATINQNAAAENARRNQERLDAERAEKDISDRAEEELIARHAAGTLTTADVLANRGALSAAALRRSTLLVKGSGGSGFDAHVYTELSDKADAGEDVREDANEALAAGFITASQRDSVLNTSRDERFVKPRKGILSALNPANSMRPDVMAPIRQESVQMYDEWVRKHPDASIEESSKRASDIIALAYKNVSRRSASGILGPLNTPDDIEAAIQRVKGDTSLKPEQKSMKLGQIMDAAEAIQMEQNFTDSGSGETP